MGPYESPLAGLGGNRSRLFIDIDWEQRQQRQRHDYQRPPPGCGRGGGCRRQQGDARVATTTRMPTPRGGSHDDGKLCTGALYVQSGPHLVHRLTPVVPGARGGDSRGGQQLQQRRPFALHRGEETPLRPSSAEPGLG